MVGSPVEMDRRIQPRLASSPQEDVTGGNGCIG